MRQAVNLMEAVSFARVISLPLVAHLTIHWAYTDISDDPDGNLFAKFREGLDKWLHRQGFAFAAVWARERQSNGQSEVVHCHMLFHLPHEYRAGKKLQQVREAIYRLIRRHGRRDDMARAAAPYLHPRHAHLPPPNEKDSVITIIADRPMTDDEWIAKYCEHQARE